MNPKNILNKYYHFAVVGVSPNKDKFGYKVFQRLLSRGYATYGVSPIYDQVDEYELYSSLEAINNPIDVVVFVVKKEHAYSYVDEMSAIGIHYAWMQPNTFDDELLDYMRNLGVTPILACVLIETA